MGRKRRGLKNADWSALVMPGRIWHGEARRDGSTETTETFRPDASSGPVLVLESDEVIADVVATALVGEGYEVVVHGLWADGLHALRAVPPRAVVVGVHGGSGMGGAVIGRLREELGESIPILVLSGRRQSSFAVDALAEGADDVIITPFSPRELLARLQRRLRSR